MAPPRTLDTAASPLTYRRIDLNALRFPLAAARRGAEYGMKAASIQTIVSCEL